jgi:molecular chaperone DnaK (HSP70)
MPTTQEPPVSTHQQVALLHFGGRPFLPTILYRLGGWDHDKGLLYDRFRLQTELDSRVRPLNTYRQFKADLLRSSSDLKREDRKGWTMLDRRSSEGKDAEVYRIVGGRRQFFNAIHAAEVFLYRLAAISVQRAKEIFPDAATIKVHFTVPAYQADDQDTAGAQGESERFREHLRSAVRGFAAAPEFENVEFRVVTGDRQWLYEPYGVYYYYSAMESQIPLREAGATYLILDMGGSTTDLAVVQVNKRGSEFQQYPTCASIKQGGVHFDQFILDRLTSAPFRGSAAERDQALSTVEEAKIAISNGAPEAELTIGKRKVSLTRSALDAALADFWVKGSNRVSLQREIRAFLQHVRDKAAQHRLFHEFDTFSGVFLAGGSTQLPRFQEIVRAELVALGMLSEATTAFATPAAGVQPGSVTSLGLAAETAQFDPLDRATAVYAHISDDTGAAYQFSLRGDAKRLENGETMLFKSDMFGPKAELEGWVNTWQAPDGKEAYSRIRLPGDRVPRHLRVRLRNDAETEYQQDEIIPVEVLSPVVRDIPLEVSLRNQFKFFADGEGVRIKPAILLHEVGPRASKKSIRLRREGETSSRVRVSYDVSLKPAPVAGDIHICIDFGMSNTSVALMAPGRDFPRDAGDLEIFTIGRDQPEPPKPEVGEILKPDPLPPVDTVLIPPQDPELLPILAEAVEYMASSAAHGDGGLTPQTAAQTFELRMWVEAALAATTVAAREAAAAAVHGETVVLERVLNTTVSELKAGLVAALSPAASVVEPRKRLPHPMDRVEEEWLADSPLQRPRVPEDQTARLRPGPVADGVEERFQRFLSDVYPSLQFEPEVVRAVLAECESDESRLIVLAGPPGTGKSQLVHVLAEFYNQTLIEEELTRFYLLQPVSPSWYSPASLQGGYSEVEGRFRETPFLTHLLQTQLHYEECVRTGTQPRLSFVCLDEFNLAQPEQYLADILSRMEAKLGSPQRVLTLCRGCDVPGLEKDITVRLTPNLKLFATLNVDASTHLLSPKVLDRSHFIRLRPSLSGLQQASKRLSQDRKVPWFHTPFAKLLPDLFTLFEEANAPIGYRALDQGYRYAAFCRPTEVDSVVDEVLCSFLLTRLPAVYAVGSRGYGQEVKKMSDICKTRYPRAGQVLRRVSEGVPGQSV